MYDMMMFSSEWFRPFISLNFEKSCSNDSSSSSSSEHKDCMKARSSAGNRSSNRRQNGRQIVTINISVQHLFSLSKTVLWLLISQLLFATGLFPVWLVIKQSMATTFPDIKIIIIIFNKCGYVWTSYVWTSSSQNFLTPR